MLLHDRQIFQTIIGQTVIRPSPDIIFHHFAWSMQIFHFVSCLSSSRHFVTLKQSQSCTSLRWLQPVHDTLLNRDFICVCDFACSARLHFCLSKILLFKNNNIFRNVWLLHYYRYRHVSVGAVILNRNDWWKVWHSIF